LTNTIKVNSILHENTFFKCNSTDQPIWFFNMKVLPPNVSPLVLWRKILRITNIELDNGGTYQCYGSNVKGHFITQWILKVYGKFPIL